MSLGLNEVDFPAVGVYTELTIPPLSGSILSADMKFSSFKSCASTFPVQYGAIFTKTYLLPFTHNFNP